MVPYTQSRALRLSSAVFQCVFLIFESPRLMIAWMERKRVLTAPAELPYTTNSLDSKTVSVVIAY